jgi:hypothetical protein
LITEKKMQAAAAALLEEGRAGGGVAPMPPPPPTFWTAVIECVGLKKHCITNLLLIFVVAVESYKLVGEETRDKLLELAVRYMNVTV